MKEKLKQGAAGVFFIFCCVVLGILLGRLIGYAEDLYGYSGSGAEDFLWLILVFGSLIVCFLLQTILHEAGHLIAGLLSGYRFVSFRIGSWTWIKNKKDGSVERKKFSLPGTLGQCLLAPPEYTSKFPCVFYNLGGVLMNLLLAVISLLLVICIPMPGFLWIFLVVNAFVGLIMALSNGVPFSSGGISNDGKVTLVLARNAHERKAFWTSLKINEAQQDGIRLKDMPDEWFVMEEDLEDAGYLQSSIAIFQENRYMDAGKYQEADNKIRELLAVPNKASGLYKNLLLTDQISCAILLQKSPEEIAALQTKQLDGALKTMKDIPSVKRTKWLMARFIENDEAKADAILTDFEKSTQTYPYLADVACERDIFADARAMI